MSKKDKNEFSSEDDVQAVITIIPKLEKLLENHKEVTLNIRSTEKTIGMRFLVR